MIVFFILPLILPRWFLIFEDPNYRFYIFDIKFKLFTISKGTRVWILDISECFLDLLF